MKTSKTAPQTTTPQATAVGCLTWAIWGTWAELEALAALVLHFLSPSRTPFVSFIHQPPFLLSLSPLSHDAPPCPSFLSKSISNNISSDFSKLGGGGAGGMPDFGGEGDDDVSSTFSLLIDFSAPPFSYHSTVPSHSLVQVTN